VNWIVIKYKIAEQKLELNCMKLLYYGEIKFIKWKYRYHTISNSILEYKY
jgi:hypothetical protein